MQYILDGTSVNIKEFVFEKIEEYALKNPNAIAMFDDTGVQMTYEKMQEKVFSLAAHLRSLGVERNQLVGLCVSRSIEAIIAMLAINKAGAAYVPIDIEWPRDRVEYIVNDTQMNYVLCHKETSEKFRHASVTCIELPDATDKWPFEIANELTTINQSSDLMYVIYTSGSTGTPKGVLIEHRGVSNYVNWASRFFENNDGNGVLLHSSLNFDITITSIYPPLLNGHPLYIKREKDDIDGLISAITSLPIGKFSLIKLTPTHLSILNSTIKQDLSNYFNTIVIGGEKLTREHLAHIDLSRCHVVNHYGPTEATCGCCANIEITRDGLDLEHDDTISIGNAIQNMSAFILDEHGNLVNENEIGELCIAGPGLARGYLNLPEKTAERFIESSIVGERLYKTGDLAKRNAEKELVFMGRKDHQVKFRGYRVELGEIEKVLLNHGDVSHAVVINSDSSNAEAELIAFVLPDLFEPTETEIKMFLKDYLPEYMMPNHISVLKEFPLTANGKVDRPALLKSYVSNLARKKLVLNMPKTKMEKIVYNVWVEVFQNEAISITDDFFEIGGHSLKAVQVISKLNQILSFNLPIKTLFEHRTIRSLSHVLESLSSSNKQQCNIDEGVVL